MSAAPRGIVRVTAPPDSGTLNLACIVARFVKKYPLVHIELSLSSRAVDLVAEGFDLAVRAGKLSDSTLIARKVGHDSLGLFASAGYLRRHGRPRGVADLARYECLLFRGKNGKAEWRLTGPKGEESVTVRGPLSVDEMSFAQQAVAAGLGIGLLPTMSVKLRAPSRDYPTPVRVLPEYSQGGGSGLFVITPSLRYQPASVTAFRDFLIEELTQLWNRP